MGHMGNVYRARAARVYPSMQRCLKKVGEVAVQGRMEAKVEEIYDRTPLPVTYALLHSDRYRLEGDRVDVYDDKDAAPHAVYRRRMTGISVTGGHRLDTQWEKTAVRKKRQQIRFIMRGALREIFGSGRNRSSFRG